jgi:hypothetical protein
MGGWSWEHDSNEEIAEKLLQVQPNRAAVVAQKIVAPTGWSWDGPDEEVAKALLTDQPEGRGG